MWAYCANLKRFYLGKKRKKKKRERQKSRKRQSWPWEGEGQFCPAHTSFFFPHFGEIELWWAQRENGWAPPLFSPPPPLIQTPFPPIFSHIFHSFFSILPQIHPSKHSVNVFIFLPYSFPAPWLFTRSNLFKFVFCLSFFGIN